MSETSHQANEMQEQGRLEAVLFLSRTPLSSRKLSQLAGLEDGTRARVLLKQLNQHYDRVGRAFHIKQVAGGYQLRTRPQFAQWIRRQEHIPRPFRLTGPALETLTVVAYRQPIIKAEIEAIRGVGCGEMLRQLLEKGLIKIAGRSVELGRPFLYATTREFLTQFGLNSLAALPRAANLVGQGLPEWATSDENQPPQVPDTDSQESNDPTHDSNPDNFEAIDPELKEKEE